MCSNIQMLLVTFHETIANIYGYNETQPGSAPTENLIESPAQLSELRGMLLANGFLYVVNGGKSVSNVLCCAPDTSKQNYYTQQSVFIPDSTTVNHPFALAFQSSGSGKPQTWYVSDQDSNVVAVYTSQSPYSSTAASSSPYLSALLTALQNANSSLASPGFLAASFIPTASVGAEIPAQTTVAPPWGGLTPVIDSSDSAEDEQDKSSDKKSKKSKVQNSVRGLALSNSVLYVADEGGNAVRMYDAATGVPLGSTTISGPVHLLVRNGNLYVNSGDSIYCGTCVSLPATIPALPALDQFSSAAPPPYPAPPSGYTNSVTLTLTDLNLGLPKGSGPSGFAFDSSGNLYVALRKLSQIYAFSPNQSGGNPFTPSANNPIFTLGDEPEFLLWIENAS
jgi:hypothetical protein